MTNVIRKKVGLIVNPIAGVGGRVGLKGSDGEAIQKQAMALGASPEAPRRTVQALERLHEISDSIELITFPGSMGEREAREAGFSPSVIGHIDEGATSASDTQKAASMMASLGVELLLFAGGDGTARNIHDALEKAQPPVLGIPAGVKIHSAVYARNPLNAGEVALQYLDGRIQEFREAEVMDIDEDAFRAGRVTARLYGYLKVPKADRLMQSMKSGRGTGDMAAMDLIANFVTENMEKDVAYIIGPGTTTRAVMNKLGLPNTLLGVDVILNGEVLASDVGEPQLLTIVRDHPCRIVVTVIGGQGYIFGRGNQQLSPLILKTIGKSNIVVIAPQTKLSSLGGNPLLIDTGDMEVNKMLSGYYRVITDYNKTIMLKAE